MFAPSGQPEGRQAKGGRTRRERGRIPAPREGDPRLQSHPLKGSGDVELDQRETTTDAQAARSTRPRRRPDTPGECRAQAATPRFQIRCETSHVAQEDPIVSRGVPSAHLHEFFGNTTTNAFSTYESMLAGGTTCSAVADTAGYWVPTLISPDGQVVRAKTILLYYRGEEGAVTVAYPPDLRVVGHDVTEGIDPSNLIVKFPECWDGVNTDSADHISHMADATGEGCPRLAPGQGSGPHYGRSVSGRRRVRIHLVERTVVHVARGLLEHMGSGGSRVAGCSMPERLHDELPEDRRGGLTRDPYGTCNTRRSGGIRRPMASSQLASGPGSLRAGL